MIMVGQIGCSERKAYWVFDPESRQCYVTRDVIFDESSIGSSSKNDILIIKNNVEVVCVPV